MNTSIPLVRFEASERVPIEVIHRQSAVLAENPLTTELLNSVLNYVFILNRHRQIVFMSRNCQDLVPGRPLESLLGLRPGEALSCQHVEGTSTSCGTTLFCQECGAAKGIVAGLMGQKNVQECHLMRVINCQPEAVDLLIYTIPFEYKGDLFAIVSVADISHEKRRRALERIFFHDIVNTAGGIGGLVELLQREAPPEHREEFGILRRGLGELLEEIQTQRDLSSAENGDLSVCPSSLDTLEVVRTEVKFYSHHPLAKGRIVQEGSGVAALPFQSDRTLLRRILGNLIKNALEAIPEGEKVTVGCEWEDGRVRFFVQNPGLMRNEAQLQVFNRSYSTKGAGRGLGTYSVKLLAEKYLRGSVGFSSMPDKGTLFWVSLPMRLGATSGVRSVP